MRVESSARTTGAVCGTYFNRSPRHLEGVADAAVVLGRASTAFEQAAVSSPEPARVREVR